MWKGSATPRRVRQALRGWHSRVESLALGGALFAAGACTDTVGPVVPERGSAHGPLVSVVVSAPMDLAALAGDPHNGANGVNDLADVVGTGETGALYWPASGNRQWLSHLDATIPFSFANDINNERTVAGMSTRLISSNAAQFTAVLWANGIPRDLNPGAVRASEATAVSEPNSLGEVWVVGNSIPTTDTKPQATLWTVSSSSAPMTLLGTLGSDGFSFALDVNDHGQVVGWSHTSVPGEGRAFIWDAVGGLRALPTPAGYESTASAINNAGQVAGWISTGSASHAVLWSPTSSGAMQLELLGTLPGGSDSQAHGLNDFGQVVGVSRLGDGMFRAFVWTRGEPMTELHSLNAICVEAPGVCAEARDISEPVDGVSVVVGASWMGSVFHATRWTVQVVPPTPMEQLDAIESDVQELVADAAISQGQGNALMAKLAADAQQLDKGKTQAAINVLEAFISQCEAYVAAGILTSAEAQPLIDAAQNLIDELGGT